MNNLIGLHSDRLKIGQNIRRLRLKRGWTQRELAARMNATAHTRPHEWETGVRTPSLTNAVRLARAFGVSVDELVKGVDL